MNIQKALQSSRFQRGSVKIAYCGWKNKMVPVINLDLSEEELNNIVEFIRESKSSLLQRLIEAQQKFTMVKEKLESE